MVPEYPYPSDRWLNEFRELLQKHGLQPICYSAYIDYGIRTDRDLTEEEIIQFTVNDMIYAKKAGIEGTVIIEADIDKEGNVVDAKIVRSIGGGLDEVSLNAVKQTRFKPGMQRGRQVKVRMTIPIKFVLQ